MADDELDRLTDEQLDSALTAYQECEATYLHPMSDHQRERAAIAGFWNARIIIPELLRRVNER